MARHQFGLAQAAASFAYVPGPHVGEGTVRLVRNLVAQGDNVHPFGSESANNADRRGDTAIAQHVRGQIRTGVGATITRTCNARWPSSPRSAA